MTNEQGTIKLMPLYNATTIGINMKQGTNK